jgi:lysozyme family protein
MASFYEFNDTVAELEGGFQKLASDPGNYNSRGELVGTNYGISAPVYEKWLGYPPSEIDMRNLSKTVAKEIFKSQYWHRLSADYINSQMVAETLVDMGINAGTGTAAKIMQRVLNEKFNLRLRVDGAIGPLSVEAINSVDPIALFQEFNAARISYYERLNNQDWLKIWKNRVQAIASKFGIDLKKKQ